MQKGNLIFMPLLAVLVFAAEVTATPGGAPLRILVLGNSLSAGFGLDEAQSYPALLAERARALGISADVINAGVSGDTTSGGLRRIGWLLKQAVDIFILELGTNDALRGLSLAQAKDNLQAIINAVKQKNPTVEILIAGMKLPPNFGEEYAQQFEMIFPQLARDNNAILIPFLLEDVAGNPNLNFPDRLHPNAAGQRILAANVWKHLEGVLLRRRQTPQSTETSGLS